MFASYHTLAFEQTVAATTLELTFSCVTLPFCPRSETRHNSNPPENACGKYSHNNVDSPQLPFRSHGTRSWNGYDIGR